MTAELISVGTEILMGNILNSNARYLAEKCASLGLDMYYQVTVGDNYERMMSVVKQHWAVLISLSLPVDLDLQRMT